MTRRARNRERGNAMVLAMIVLTALATLSGLTVVSVQGGISTTSTDRFHTMAMYAAESGGAAALDFLRANVDPTTGWSTYISANNTTIQQPTGILGNNVALGGVGNPLSTDSQGWYSVQILNNRGDTGYATGVDVDKRVVVRVTGYGPNGAVAILEWEVQAGTGVMSTPCGEYAQKAMSDNGGGNNDCLGAINSGDTATMRPGGP